jgi:hypothetical protein
VVDGVVHGLWRDAVVEKERYFNAGAGADDLSMPPPKPETVEPAQAETGFWQKLKKLWSR